MYPERQWAGAAAREIASTQMGKQFHNGCEKLAREAGILEIFRYCAGGPERPNPPLE